MKENEIVKVTGFNVRAVNGGGFIIRTTFDNPDAAVEESIAGTAAKLKKIVKRLMEEAIEDNPKKAA